MLFKIYVEDEDIFIEEFIDELEYCYKISGERFFNSIEMDRKGDILFIECKDMVISEALIGYLDSEESKDSVIDYEIIGD